jgi:hypothetical protein
MKTSKCPTCAGSGFIQEEGDPTLIGPAPQLERLSAELRPSAVDREWDLAIPHDPSEEPTRYTHVPHFFRPKREHEPDCSWCSEGTLCEATTVRPAALQAKRTWPRFLLAVGLGLALGFVVACDWNLIVTYAKHIAFLARH